MPGFTTHIVLHRYTLSPATVGAATVVCVCIREWVEGGKEGCVGVGGGETDRQTDKQGKFSIVVLLTTR